MNYPLAICARCQKMRKREEMRGDGCDYCRNPRLLRPIPPMAVTHWAVKPSVDEDAVEKFLREIGAR